MNRYELRTEVWKRNLTVLEKVEYVLKGYPDAREDERVLLAIYYDLFHDKKIPDWVLYGGKSSNGNSIPQLHSVRRMARKVQNTFGKYKPSIEQKHTREEFSASHKSYHV